jgi:hypothetical protein
VNNAFLSFRVEVGPKKKEKKVPVPVGCDALPKSSDIFYPHKPVAILTSLTSAELEQYMEDLASKFSGCRIIFDLMDTTTLQDEDFFTFEVPKNRDEAALIEVSYEQSYKFAPGLDKASRLFLFIQSLLLLPIVLLFPKPIFKFISRGKNFFLD